MSALQVLQNRVSVTKLTAPPPNAIQLEELFKAAARAPDHGKLEPWRFLVIQEEGLSNLSKVFVDALLSSAESVSPAVIEKAKNMPFRAPMIIVAIARCQDHIKVPKLEQIMASAAATQNILLALFAQGFGAVWRTGNFAYDKQVKLALGLTELEEIIGFIYVGTPVQPFPQPPEVNLSKLFAHWPTKNIAF